ncbi:hypothetical protein [Bernardetia sp.]|uniref:hypothetical protein n=1 Tax=Bernardetia sp. TaxID=1937974 RepID=UPI0025C6BEF8|nr:hypothetical protein [Bernardetia sp.]
MKIKIIDRKHYFISVDKVKNRVYYFLTTEKWELEDADTLLSDWKEVLTHVLDNFTILSDIRNLMIQSRKLEAKHEEAQKYVAENGLLKLARVLSKDDIVNLQFSRITQRSEIPNDVFDNSEDAEKYLDQIVQSFQTK